MKYHVLLMPQITTIGFTGTMYVCLSSKDDMQGIMITDVSDHYPIFLFKLVHDCKKGGEVYILPEYEQKKLWKVYVTYYCF